MREISVVKTLKHNTEREGLQYDRYMYVCIMKYLHRNTGQVFQVYGQICFFFSISGTLIVTVPLLLLQGTTGKLLHTCITHE